MPIWPDSYIAQLLVDAEIDISKRLSLIFHRFSLNITSGNALYDLPSFVQGVIRITWKGRKVFPLSRGEMIDLDNTFLTKTGKVDYYSLSGDGIFKIRFYRIPTENVNSTTSGLDGPEIINRVIVSCYRKPDSTTSNLNLPDYLARRVTKYYVLSKAFQREGLGQNLKAAQYYAGKYNGIIGQLLLIKEKYYSTKVHMVGNTDSLRRSRRPQYAQLPSDFSINA